MDGNSDQPFEDLVFLVGWKSKVFPDFIVTNSFTKRCPLLLLFCQDIVT